MSTYGVDGLTALGDPTRRAIFERLAGGPLPVGELARDLPVSRPAVSQHLKVLKEAGLVGERREGTRRIYGVEPSGVAPPSPTGASSETVRSRRRRFHQRQRLRA